VDDKDANEVNKSNCFNSTGGDQGGPMGFNFVYTTVSQTSAAITLAMSWTALFATLSTAFFLL
jgi:hypothetical protein